MNDHNLDDLIINDIEPKNSKTKSFLTIIALLIVILIVAIILTKVILKDPNTQQIALEENHTEMISPELTLQSATKPKPITKEEPKLSNIIENTLEIPVPAPEALKKEKVVKKTEPAKETVKITKEVIEVPVQPEVKTETENSVKEEKLQQEYAEIRKERLAKEKAAQEEKAKAEIKKEIPKAVKPVPVKITEKAKQYPTIKTVKAPKTVPAKTYYIQVGSFVKTPSSRFLGIIKKSGFNYKITPRAANGTKKLLIGPYKNRASANAALARVKDRINKSAFVIKK